MKNRRAYSILLIMVGMTVMVLGMDLLMNLNYFVRIPIKFCLFLLIPWLSCFIGSQKKEYKNSLFYKQGILYSILFGVVIYFSILCIYFLSINYIDYSQVASSLSHNFAVTKENYLIVSLNISLFNSLLEELFFRGYGFLILNKYMNTTLANVVSALLFAIYHIGILLGMFSIPIIILMILGLFAVGFVFNKVDEYFNSIYPSWFIHMFANFAINTIGFWLIC